LLREWEEAYVVRDWQIIRGREYGGVDRLYSDLRCFYILVF
jgi:hypothetical protein